MFMLIRGSSKLCGNYKQNEANHVKVENINDDPEYPEVNILEENTHFYLFLNLTQKSPSFGTEFLKKR